ncbi:hypothetical protein CCH79_00005979 [Gambusia affinis]|uniref:Insulin-like domain-containing protein n=1 Tax=Gambusia affinis TaxID=33528 RepID=A0A315VKR7_GAMAF|nr:hypothetical protein CCH79_00005979 [Gambusia affinis]
MVVVVVVNAMSLAGSERPPCLLLSFTCRIEKPLHLPSANDPENSWSIMITRPTFGGLEPPMRPSRVRFPDLALFIRDHQLLYRLLQHSGPPSYMARVPWTFSMLFLLVFHSPGASLAPNQHLCGSHLVDALYFICGERGFYYGPNRAHKRDLENLLGTDASKSGILMRWYGNFLYFKGFLAKRARVEERLWRVLSARDEPKVKRGIVEQCCHKPCSIHHLEDYCN